MSVVSFIKTAMFLFPFIKELFLGKNPPRNSTSVSLLVLVLKRMTIALGCFSVAINVYLSNRVYTLAASSLALSREIAHLKQLRTDQAKQPVPPTQIVLPVKNERNLHVVPPLAPAPKHTPARGTAQKEHGVARLREINSIQ